MNEIDLYCNLMEEVKKRVAVVKGFQNGQINALYKATTIESEALQLRKILELIALGSLVTHREEYSRQYKRFESHWHAERILRDIEKINPDYYPMPVKEIPSTRPKVKTDVIKIDEGFLTKEEFISAYNALGEILHAKNPFAIPMDYGRFNNLIGTTLDKIIKLLNMHEIRMYKSPNFLLVHMKEENDNRVHAYVFAPVDDKKDSTEPDKENVDI